MNTSFSGNGLTGSVLLYFDLFACSVHFGSLLEVIRKDKLDCVDHKASN